MNNLNIRNIELSVVLPCLNEAKWLPNVINHIREKLQASYIENYEIIVVDNMSTDQSQEVARNLGAKIVSVSKRGYGYALQGGFKAAKYDYILMLDADGSYDLNYLNEMSVSQISVN